jgi:predicted neuraminidase
MRTILIATTVLAASGLFSCVTSESRKVELPTLGDLDHRPGVVRSEFIFESATFASCHAPTIAETRDGLIAAWFGGSGEGRPDVGIWVARRGVAGWSVPVEIADGRQTHGMRYPAWNPVLFRSADGPLVLFYKVGPNASGWWGMRAVSADDGKTWSQGQRLPEGILGPIKNKPILLPDHSLLCGSSTEAGGWRVHMESTPDLGKTWTAVGPLNNVHDLEVIQPTILRYPSGKIQILCRSKQGRIAESWAKTADGQTWTPMQLTSLPNPNSGIDSVVLNDGRALLVYNHTTGARSPLNVAVSEDGRTWNPVLVLEDGPGEYSYPAVIQTADGFVHIVYTWQRTRIKHVVLDPRKFVPGRF